MSDPNTLWSIRELAQYLRVCPRTAWTLVSRGLIPAIRFSCRLIRFRPEEVEKAVEALRKPPQQPNPN